MTIATVSGGIAPQIVAPIMQNTQSTEKQGHGLKAEPSRRSRALDIHPRKERRNFTVGFQSAAWLMGVAARDKAPVRAVTWLDAC